MDCLAAPFDGWSRPGRDGGVTPEQRLERPRPSTCMTAARSGSGSTGAGDPDAAGSPFNRHRLRDATSAVIGSNLKSLSYRSGSATASSPVPSSVRSTSVASRHWRGQRSQGGRTRRRCPAPGGRPGTLCGPGCPCCRPTGRSSVATCGRGAAALRRWRDTVDGNGAADLYVRPLLFGASSEADARSVAIRSAGASPARAGRWRWYQSIAAATLSSKCRS